MMIVAVGRRLWSEGVDRDMPMRVVILRVAVLMLV
jgi:hypothetical protein